ncbi:MAG: hypothetical protein PHE29_13510 [Tissierellia bacterium]|nr:hypothetical protein [Tissierellia bacterium]
MSYYEYDTGYYEPSELDILLDEYIEKMKSVLLGSVQQEIESLRKENTELKEKEKGFIDRERQLSYKERDLKNKADNLKREVENEFYNKTVTENLEKVLDTIDVYYAGVEYKQGKKCNLCNDNRELVAIFPNGTEQHKRCDCAKEYRFYTPMMSTNKMLKIKQRKGQYNYPKRFIFESSYKANPRDDYDYGYDSFKLIYFFDKFGEDVKGTHKNRGYGENIAFYNEKACKKYCDWLNDKEE